MANLIDLDTARQERQRRQELQDRFDRRNSVYSRYDQRFDAVADLHNFLRGEAGTKDLRVLASRLFDAIAYGRLRNLRLDDLDDDEEAAAQ
jgi:hypothetical protein